MTFQPLLTLTCAALLCSACQPELAKPADPETETSVLSDGRMLSRSCQPDPLPQPDAQAFTGMENPAYAWGKTARGHYLESQTASIETFGALRQTLSAEGLQGKRVRLSAKLGAQGVSGWAGLWMRVDTAEGGVMAFDNMETRPVTGTVSAQRYEVVLDVPQGAASVVFGALLTGSGRIELEQVRLEHVCDGAPTTDGRFFLAGSMPEQYAFEADSAGRSVTLRSTTYLTDGFGTAMRVERAALWRGQRLRLSAKVATVGAIGWAGLWMRVDGADGAPLAFDNMSDRPLVGDTAPAEAAVVLDVPATAQKVAFGVLLVDGGRVEVTDLALEAVDAASVATTR